MATDRALVARQTNLAKGNDLRLRRAAIRRGFREGPRDRGAGLERLLDLLDAEDHDSAIVGIPLYRLLRWPKQIGPSFVSRALAQARVWEHSTIDDLSPAALWRLRRVLRERMVLHRRGVRRW